MVVCCHCGQEGASRNPQGFFPNMWLCIECEADGSEKYMQSLHGQEEVKKEISNGISAREKSRAEALKDIDQRQKVCDETFQKDQSLYNEKRQALIDEERILEGYLEDVRKTIKFVKEHKYTTNIIRVLDNYRLETEEKKASCLRTYSEINDNFNKVIKVEYEHTTATFTKSRMQMSW